MNNRVFIVLPIYPPNIRAFKILYSFLNKGDEVYLLADRKIKSMIYEDLINKNKKNLKIIFIGNVLPINFPYNILRNKRIRYYIYKLKPNYVWCMDIFLNGFLNGKYKKKSINVKYIIDICDNYPEVYSSIPSTKFKGFITKLLNKIEKNAVTIYDLTIFVSNNSYDYIKNKYRLSIIKHFILYNLPYRINIDIKDKIIKFSKRKIVYIGTLDDNIRDIKTVINAVNYLKNDKNYNVYFDIYYFNKDINLVKQYINMCKNNGIENNIRFEKAVVHSKLNKTLQKYNIGIIPHYRNKGTDYTIPNKLFDYMLNGLCVLVSDNPSLKEIIEKYNVGKVYKGGNYIDCAFKIKEIFDSDDLEYYKIGNKIINEGLNWNNYFNDFYNKFVRTNNDS